MRQDVPARRKGAARELFLPGGWLAQRDVSFESWKATLYEQLLGGMVVTRSAADLFQVAWQRVLAGDEPRYTAPGESR